MTEPRIDWDAGRYESSAWQLLPAAEQLVAEAAPRAGEHVIDVGCGTGNGAILAAARGARVTGVDPAPRLLEVARMRARDAALDVTFVAGAAEALPFADGAADVVLSVFGVIFAPDAAGAAAELARVTAGDARLLFTAWMPGGAIGQANQTALEAVRRAVGTPSQPPPFPWHDPDALERLLDPYGFTLAVKEHDLAFTAASARDFLDAQRANHPMAVAARQVLERYGIADETYRRSLAILDDGNEDPTAFRVTTRYITVAARRDAP